MKKFRNLPAIITLLAGFIVSVIMIVMKYSLKDFLWILVAVMAGFFVAGMLISVVLNLTVGKDEKDEKEDAQNEETDNQGTESDLQEQDTVDNKET